MATEKKEISLYNGEVDITFYPVSHRYKLKGQKTYLIGVTTATGVLDKSRALLPWAVGLAGEYLRKYIGGAEGDTFYAHELLEQIDVAVKQHTIRKEQAATAGSMVHEWAEQFILSILEKTETPKIDPEWQEEVLMGVNAFLDWYNAHNVKFEATERILYSRQHEYVGTCDAIAEIDGKRYLIDFKTSRGLYNEHNAQISAYVRAYEEETNDELDGAMILKFGKEDGNFEIKEFTREEIEKHYQAFLAMLTIKKWDKSL